MLLTNCKGQLLLHSEIFFNNTLVTTPVWKYFSSPKAAKSHTTPSRMIFVMLQRCLSFTCRKRSSNPLEEGQCIKIYMEKIKFKVCRTTFPKGSSVRVEWEFFIARVRKSILQQQNEHPTSYSLFHIEIFIKVEFHKVNYQKSQNNNEYNIRY